MRALKWTALVCLLPLACFGLNVRDFGAAGDGVTDDTAAFQKALDAAGAAGGGVVDVPAAHYRINGTLRIPGGVTLQGTYRVPPTHEREGRPKLDGSVLLAYAGRGSMEGAPFILLAGSSATLAGVIVSYPEWKQTDVPPAPYPPTVVGQSGTANVSVQDCCFLGCYEAIHLDGAARFLVRNCYGYPSYRGLYVDNCYDIGRVENCHFWPFGVVYDPHDPYCLWVNTNGTAFEFARTDWQYVLNTFCFGYGVGYKFSKTKAGACNGNFVGIGADCCRRAILVEQMQPFGVLITNGEFVGRWTSTDSVTIEIAEDADLGKLSLSNCAFWGPIDRCVWSRSPMVQFSAIGCHFFEWDVNGKGAPAIQIDAGKALVQANTFGEGSVNVVVGEDAASAIVSANQAPLGFRLESQAGKRTQAFGNEADPRAYPKDWLKHYTVHVGALGDVTFVKGWFRRDKASVWPDKKGSMRWSTGASVLRLPVAPRKAYTLSVDLYVPKNAIDPQNGLYIGERKIADLPAQEGPALVTAQLEASKAGTVEVTLRSKTWNPKDLGLHASDVRNLGVAVRSITMKSKGATREPVNANTGDLSGN